MFRLVLTAASAILLLAGLVAAKFEFSDRLGPRSPGVSGFYRHAPVDLLFVGSSHTRQGYDARELERATSMSVYLVAYNGFDLASAEPLIADLLANAATRPKVLVVEAYSLFLARKEGLQDPRYYFDSPPRWKKRIITNYLGSSERSGKYLDVFDLAVNRNNELILTYPLNARLTASLSYNGASTGRGRPGVTAAQLAAFRPVLDGRVEVPAQLAALRRIVEDCRARHLPLYFIEPPMPAPISGLDVTQRFKRRFREELSSADVPYLDGDDGFDLSDPALFADSNHLSSAGAVLFSQKVGSLLVRWIASLRAPGKST